MCVLCMHDYASFHEQSADATIAEKRCAEFFILENNQTRSSIYELATFSEAISLLGIYVFTRNNKN